MHVTLNVSATLCEESIRSIGKLKKTEAAKLVFESNKQVLLSKLDMLEHNCQVNLEDIRAKLMSPELVEKLLEFIEVMKATELRRVDQSFTEVFRKLAQFKATVSQLEFNSWRTSEEPWQYIATHISEISDEAISQALLCDFKLNADKLEEDLKTFVKFNLELNFSHLACNQVEMYIPKEHTNKLECLNLQSMEARVIEIKKIHPFRASCFSLLLPDGSLCVVGSESAASQVQRIAVRELKAKIYPPIVPDSQFASYTYFDNKLYAIGGGSNSTTCAVLNLISIKWGYLGELKAPCLSAFSIARGQIASILIGSNFSFFDIKSNEWTYTSDFEDRTLSPIFIYSVQNDYHMLFRNFKLNISNLGSKCSQVDKYLGGALCSTVNLHNNCLFFSLKEMCSAPTVQANTDIITYQRAYTSRRPETGRRLPHSCDVCTQSFDSQDYSYARTVVRSASMTTTQVVSCYSWNLSTQSLSSVRFSNRL
jgi:hypothetical protein